VVLAQSASYGKHYVEQKRNPSIRRIPVNDKENSNPQVVAVDSMGLLAAMLCRAWKRYLEEYGMPPDGSFEQLQELVHLVPEVRRILKKD